MASSIVTLSVIDAWKEGTTVDAIKAVQAEIETVAQSLDGVILLRFGNDEANRRNSVSEVYKDADALKAFINEGLKEGGPLPELLALVDQVPGTVLFQGPQAELDKLADVAEMFKNSDPVIEIVSFIRGDSPRAVIQPEIEHAA